MMSTTYVRTNETRTRRTGIGATLPPYGYGGRVEAMVTEQTFKLDEKQEQDYERMLKKGVYHELHKQGLITNTQLARMLERLAKGGAVGC